MEAVGARHARRVLDHIDARPLGRLDTLPLERAAVDAVMSARRGARALCAGGRRRAPRQLPRRRAASSLAGRRLAHGEVERRRRRRGCGARDWRRGSQHELGCMRAGGARLAVSVQKLDRHRLPRARHHRLAVGEHHTRVLGAARLRRRRPHLHTQAHKHGARALRRGPGARRRQGSVCMCMACPCACACAWHGK